MPVVINEMEVEAGKEGEAEKAKGGGKSGGKQLDPREIERVVVKEMQRHSRIRAH